MAILKIGEILRGMRKGLYMTQGQFAEYVGTNKSNIKAWESGKAYPNNDNIQRLISVFPESGEILGNLWRVRK